MTTATKQPKNSRACEALGYFPSNWSDAERAAWRLPADVNVWEWADMYRYLDPRTSSESGRYVSARVPYMRGPQEAFCDSEVGRITVMSAAQVTKSTSIENMIGYCIDQDPGPAIHLSPTEASAEYISQDRIAPMVRLSAQLRSHWSGSAREMQRTVHQYDRMPLYFGWSGSETEVAMRPARYVFIDEPDRFADISAAAKAINRATTFWDHKIVSVCTPTTPLGYIASQYTASNRQEYYCPCPRCGEWEVWVLGRIKVPAALRDPDEVRRAGDVWYECSHCGCKIREDAKGDLVEAGRWLAAGLTIDADGNIKGTALRGRRHSGFHIRGLLSPFSMASWSEIMAKWFEATTPEGIAQGKLIVFINETVGDPYEETGKKVKASTLKGLRGDHAQGTVPDWVRILVAGADYHKTITRGVVTIVYEVRGFGYGLRNCVITSGWVNSFDELDDIVLMSPFPWSEGTANEKKAWLPVVAELIDSGYESDDVYEYARRHPGIVFPTKGEPGPRRAPLIWSDLEKATARRLNAHQRKIYKGMQLGIIDTHYFKDQVTNWAEPILDADGKIIADARTSFYDEIPSVYFTEFTNEQKVRHRNKAGHIKYEWQPLTTGSPTHSLDTAVLAAAAGYYKGVHYMKDPKRKAAKPIAARAPVRRVKVRRVRPGGFLDGMPRL